MSQRQIAIFSVFFVAILFGVFTYIFVFSGDGEVLSAEKANIESSGTSVESSVQSSGPDGLASPTTVSGMQLIEIAPEDEQSEEETKSSGYLSEEENLRMILSSPTRNSSFDSNRFFDIPMKDIPVSGLTEQADLYQETLLSTENSGYFRVKCEVSHFAYDDPIVFPGEPGNGHLHMFFGNTKTNAYSTFESLMNSGTGTCNGEDLNRSAYWIPALLDAEGNALIPDHIMVYYKNDNFRLDGANELVEPFPDNLRIIAGEGRATEPQTGLTGEPGTLPHISFSCGPHYQSVNPSAIIPERCTGQALELKIAFPSCWNGKDLYTKDQSHMAQPINGYYGSTCPDSHPNDISSIMYRIFYKPEDFGGVLEDLHLSSDVRDGKLLPGGTTLHADWFGAWHPEAMDMWVQNCNNTQADCETGILDREPMISMVQRKRGFYERGYKVPAADLADLCPQEEFDPSNPVVSVSHCGHGSSNK